MRRTIFLCVISAFLLAACNLPASGPEPHLPDVPSGAPGGLNQDLMATIVAATFQALTPASSAPASTPALPTPDVTQTPAPSSTPTPSGDNVSGKVCYHDQDMLALTIYFQNTGDNKLWTESVTRPNEDYSITLPPGTYRVYAWPPDYTVGVLSEGRPTIQVAAGQTLTNLNLCDYSQGPFAVPYPPGVSPSDQQGSISGNISGYGGGDRLTVVAFNQGTGYWYYVRLRAGETNYVIEDLPAGTYQVVAYGSGAAGGTAPNISVLAGKDTAANVSDWASAFPSNPVN